MARIGIYTWIVQFGASLIVGKPVLDIFHEDFDHEIYHVRKPRQSLHVGAVHCALLTFCSGVGRHLSHTFLADSVVVKNLDHRLTDRGNKGQPPRERAVKKPRRDVEIRSRPTHPFRLQRRPRSTLYNDVHVFKSIRA